MPSHNPSRPPLPEAFSWFASRRGPGFPGRGGAPGPEGSPFGRFPLDACRLACYDMMGEERSANLHASRSPCLRRGFFFFPFLSRPFREILPMQPRSDPGGGFLVTGRDIRRSRSAIRRSRKARRDGCGGRSASGGTHEIPSGGPLDLCAFDLYAFPLPGGLFPFPFSECLALHALGSGCLVRKAFPLFPSPASRAASLGFPVSRLSGCPRERGGLLSFSVFQGAFSGGDPPFFLFWREKGDPLSFLSLFISFFLLSPGG